MQRQCVDCGLSLCKNPSGTNWPKRCLACKHLRVSAHQRKHAAVLSATRTAVRRGLSCQGCGVDLSPAKRGRRPKWCEGCLPTVRSQQEKDRRQRAKAIGTDRIHRAACKQCGVEFGSSRKNQKHCSTECAHLASRNRLPVTCLQCGEAFEESVCRASARRFCSWACWQESHAIPPCKCQQCGKDFKRKLYSHAWQGKNKFCSRECAWDARWGEGRPRKGGSAAAKRSWSQKTRTTTIRHRCKHYGCPCDVTCTREAVCERDGWVCQQCGIQCHKGEWRIDAATRKTDPRNAEHDHIWPLSVRGGPGNVLENSQCLCRRCNGKKRNKLGGQLRLSLTG
jgi:hypothetical protein